MSAAPTEDKKKREEADAKVCDTAIGDYVSLQQRLDNLQRPSTIRSWPQLAWDVTRSVGGGIMVVLRFIAATPGYIRGFISMSKEDWAKWKAGAWKTVKHEAHHYWVGTKLLGYEIRISTRLAFKAATGNPLSRRERSQLTRTAADVFRLVPMVVILVIPLLEFLLPVLLRIFPNMLPSTYEDKLKKEEELKRRLTVKLELARFLQDTVSEMAKDISRRKGSTSASDLNDFITKVRNGEPVDNADIVKFAQLFNDELTLEKLERVQLVSMCQFVGIAPFGTDAFLRNRLKSQLRQIKQDDLEIEEEGVEELTEEELRTACRARGMRAPYGEGATVFMRRQLQDWLDLSLHRGLPSSLLLLSRAFTITASVRDVAKKKDLAYEKIKEQLSVISDDIVEEVGYEQLGDDAKGLQALQKKLDMLKREEMLIKEELSRAAAIKEKAAAAAAPKKADAGKEGSADVAVTAEAAAATESDAAAAAPAKPAKTSPALSTEERQQRLQKTLQALMELASGSGLAKERAQFLKLLKVDTDRLNEDLLDVMTGPHRTLTTAGGTMAFGSKFTGAAPAPTATEEEEEGGAAPKRLTDRVSKMLHDIEKELDNVEKSIGSKMRLLDIDNDGIISQQELEHAVRFLREQLSPEELQDLYAHLGKKAGTPGSFELDKLLEMAADQDFTVAPRDEADEAGAGKDKDGVKIHTI
ncbi:hypothetical protein FOA52_004800 [Chlamydomonas sp. UWO 241]|nr:hypothetical protein FOA52_004800 [Chlamydomonas sp. UWO 241]